MNKQEFRMKDKNRTFKSQKAPVIEEQSTSLSGATLDNNISMLEAEINSLDDLYSGGKQSTSLAPDNGKLYKTQLILSIIAVLATLLMLFPLSGAK